MNWFKRQNTAEVCGFLDKRGKFYKNKKDRDYADYYICLEEIKRKKEGAYDNYIRYATTPYNEKMSILYEIKSIIDRIDSRDLQVFIDARIEYEEDLRKLNEYYNK